MSRALQKHALVGPRTCVSYSPGEGHVVFASAGGSINVYETSLGRFLATEVVFPSHAVHGMTWGTSTANASTANVAFHGHKSVAVYTRVPLRPGMFDGGGASWGDAFSLSLRDLVMSSQILVVGADNEHSSSIAIGFAHNFVEIWDWRRNCCVHSVVCPTQCLLHSLSFHGSTRRSLIVAAGTVFNQILLWRVDDEGGEKAGAVRHRLCGHEGVIFRVVWSCDARRIASVSDDRTVRLWEASGDGDGSYALAWSAWGHSERVWDVAFVARGGLVTASEDGTLRVWNNLGECVSTLQGHSGKNVWRVAVNPQNRSWIASGGADATVKLWDLQHQLTCCRGDASASATTATSVAAAATLLAEGDDTVRRFEIPRVRDESCDGSDVVVHDADDGDCQRQSAQDKRRKIGESAEEAKTAPADTTALATAGFEDGGENHQKRKKPKKKKKKKKTGGKKRREAVSSVHLVGDGETCVVVCCDGSVWLVELRTGEWRLAHNSGSTEDAASLAASSSAINNSDRRLLLLGSPCGHISIVDLSTDAQSERVAPIVWRAHEVRVINVFWEDSLLSSGGRRAREEAQAAAPRRLITAAASGDIKRWCCVHDGSRWETRLVESFANPAERIGRNPAAVASCAAICSERGLLICGDSRGTILVYTLSSRAVEHREDEVAQERPASTPIFMLRRAHQIQHITALRIFNGNVFSAGHDGFVHEHVLEMANDSIGHVTAGMKTIASYPASPITAVTNFWLEWTSTPDSTVSVIVAGFHSCFFMIWNLTKRCQLLRVSSGGWRRANATHFRTAPSQGHTFAFAAPCGESTVLETHSTILNSDRAVVDRRRPDRQLGPSFHGQQITCAHFLPTACNASSSMLLLTASEDCTVKLMQLALRRTGCSGEHLSTTCVQTLTPHVSSVRALCSTHHRGRAPIIASGGGKEQLRVWKLVPDGAGAAGTPSRARIVHFGTAAAPLNRNRDQQRILTLSAFPIAPPADAHQTFAHAIVAGTSNGDLLVFVVAEIPEETCQLVCKLQAAQSPILCSDHYIQSWGAQGPESYIVATGSTSGQISVWDLTGVLSCFCMKSSASLPQQDSVEASVALAAEGATLKPLVEYSAHQMGTNTLSVSRHRGSTATCDLVIGSGGDDQAIAIAHVELSRGGGGGATVVGVEIVEQASGSALKGVNIVDARFLYAVGYDQRLAVWRLTGLPLRGGLTKTRPGSSVCVEWLTASTVEVTDVAALDTIGCADGTSAVAAAVVGQGLQALVHRPGKSEEKAEGGGDAK